MNKEILISPITGKPYMLCANCGHIKQAHFSIGREHPCSNSDNFPKFCNCIGWKEVENDKKV